MVEYAMIIDGQKIMTQATVGVINPAIEEAFAQIPVGTPAHVDQAVAAARAAFPAWSALSHNDRKARLHQLADALEANMSELMQLVTQETGKPMRGFGDIGSGMEVGGAIAWLRATAETELPVEVVQDDDEVRVEVHRKPIGVVGSITPWNWPLMIAIWHYAPALLAGNTVVGKPSEFTPATTLRFTEIANEILPPGVLNVVVGAGDVGAAIASHPDINKIAFTGSSSTGRSVMRAASGNLKRLTLELGGNDAGIVLPDVDPKEVAQKLFTVCFHNNGQTCQALKRLYVHADIYDEVCNEMGAIANSVKVGNGLEEDTDLGPLQNKKQLDIVCELAADARSAGAQFLTGGEAAAGPGYFFPPTVVTNITDGTRLVDEEQFGPIVPVIKYSDVDDAITRANNNPAGLGGSVWSRDVERATELAARLESGSVWVNAHADIQPNAPMGGMKQSGIGCEFGYWGLAENTDIQTVKIRKS
ncbi:MAG: aldehyde dehydrogenase family protein [Pseudomonadota bacterium]|nr:aldehyde dehydrogenase family protein [Pseudomonadota bacterium]